LLILPVKLNICNHKLVQLLAPLDKALIHAAHNTRGNIGNSKEQASQDDFFKLLIVLS